MVHTWLRKNSSGFILLPWLIVAMSCLSLKYNLLVSGGFRESALGFRASGLLSGGEKFLLFRLDLLFCFLYLPLVLCCLAYLLPQWVRLPLSALAAMAVELALVLEAGVFQSLGTFVSLKTLWASAIWMLNSGNPCPLEELDTAFAAWLLAVIVVTALAYHALRRSVRWVNYACLAIFGAGALAGALTLLSRFPDMAWSAPLVESAAYGLAEVNPAANAVMEVKTRDLPGLLRLYREISLTPPPSHSDLFGKAPDYNVLLFVMEAIPAQVFDPANDPLRDMPNVRRLREHALVSQRHYTSFPLTNRATFSIFTSLYTSRAVGPEIDGRRIEFPGMILSLKRAGYRTGFYGYVWKAATERDDCMLPSLGFDRIVEPAIDPAADPDGATTFFGDVKFVASHDAEVLHSLRQDIRQWTMRKQRFVAAFFPEIGHDPWRSLGGPDSASLQERGHALAVHQDSWLGELIQELERGGALQHTIIVVTADHGLRMLRAPSSPQGLQLVSHGKLEDIVMRVPLLVYVPGVLSSPAVIPWPSSHIDLAPTVLDLLGVTAGRELEEGKAIWNPALAKRRVFLPMDTFGATGFVDRDGYYMRNTAGTIFKSSTLHFSDQDVMARDSAEVARVQDRLAIEDELQRTLVSRVLLSYVPDAARPAAGSGRGTAFTGAGIWSRLRRFW